jgi:hypothetical protein
MFAKENKNMKEKEKKKIKRKKPERNPIGRPIFLVMRGSLKRPYEVGRCRWWPITETTRTSSVPHFRRARPSPTHHILLPKPNQKQKLFHFRNGHAPPVPSEAKLRWPRRPKGATAAAPGDAG